MMVMVMMILSTYYPSYYPSTDHHYYLVGSPQRSYSWVDWSCRCCRPLDNLHYMEEVIMKLFHDTDNDDGNESDSNYDDSDNDDVDNDNNVNNNSYYCDEHIYALS